MTPSERVLKAIEPYMLLNHPFYQDWNMGKVDSKTLALYSRQYFHHVNAFPRYISAIHSQCEDLQTRQMLLENLNDEEKGSENHPELWMRFAESFDQNRDQIRSEKLMPETKNIIDTFFAGSRAGFENGMGCLLAYESQVPDVATFKVDSLKKYYPQVNEAGQKFFEVHKAADIYHTATLKEVIDSMDDEQIAKVEESAVGAAKALWGFLDGIQATRPQ